MARPYKFRELVKVLRKYDPRFEVWEARGKGSERIIYHPEVNGRPESHPVKYHVELWIESCQERDTLHQALDELGWQSSAQMCA